MTMVLPQELVTEILSRLPVKSLLRFKSTCSSWHHLIDSPLFINSHLTTAAALKVKGNNNYTILTEPIRPARPCPSWIRADPPRMSLVSGDTFHVIREVILPYFGESGFSASGPCNGLFCLIGKNHPVVHRYDGLFSQKIALWNPATRKLEILPYSPVPPGRRYSIIALGFGFDAADSDYKVVKIVWAPAADAKTYYHAYVYSSKKNCWTEVRPPPRINMNETECFGYHNGSYYWLDLNCNTLLSFDMHSNVFHVSSLPIGESGEHWMVSFGVQDDDSLVILVHWSKEASKARVLYTHETGIIDSWNCREAAQPALKLYEILVRDEVYKTESYQERWYEILVRNEVSKTWSHQGRVKDYSFMHTRFCINGTVIGHGHDADHLVSYNVETQEQKRIRVYYEGHPFTIVLFVESLVSVNRGESLPEEYAR